MTASRSTKYIRINSSPEFNMSLVGTSGRLCFNLLRLRSISRWSVSKMAANVQHLHPLPSWYPRTYPNRRHASGRMASSTYHPVSRNLMGAGIAVKLNRIVVDSTDLQFTGPGVSHIRF
jgi:hypothetical protein